MHKNYNVNGMATDMIEWILARRWFYMCTTFVVIMAEINDRLESDTYVKIYIMYWHYKTLIECKDHLHIK